MLRISDVLRDVASLQILCHLLFGDTQGMSLALPIDEAFVWQSRLPGMRTVLHLLASCKQLMMPHRYVTLQWRKQFNLDAHYEGETEANLDVFAEDAYLPYAYDGEWNSSDGDSD